MSETPSNLSEEQIIRNGPYKKWLPQEKDAFDERIAIMREGQNIPDNEETSTQILIVACQQAARAGKWK